MDPNPTSTIFPWYLAALWGVIIVIGAYTLLFLLSMLFPRGWRHWHRQRLEPFRRLKEGPGNPTSPQEKGVRPCSATEKMPPGNWPHG